MTATLNKGYNYEIKQEFVARSKAKNKDNLYNSLNIITGVEEKYSKSIFELEDKDIFESFKGRLNYRSLDSFRSIVGKYYKVWIEHQSRQIPNEVCHRLGSWKLINEVARGYCANLTTSLKELLMYVDKVNLAYKERYVAVITLSYMGMKPKAIVAIRVGDIDFENRIIITDTVIYTNVSDIIMNVLKNLKSTLKNPTGYLIQKKNGEECAKERISDYATILRIKLSKIGYTKDTELVHLRDNACLCYYRNNKEKIDNDRFGIYKILRAFGLYDSKNVSAFTNGQKKFNYLQNIDDNDRKDEYLFDVEVKLPPEEADNLNKHYIDNNSLEKISESSGKEMPCKGDTDIDYDAKKQREKQDNLGIENEKKVKEFIKEYDKTFKVTKMKDCSGYDLRVQTNNKTYRLEVKTINKDLEFDISINQINSIFDINKSNYVIVVVNNEDIYVIENVEEILGLSKDFVQRLIKIPNKFSMIAMDFKIKLNLELFESLKTLSEYLQNILTENELVVDYAY